MISEVDVDIRCDLFYLDNSNLYTWNRKDNVLLQYSQDFSKVIGQRLLLDSLSAIYSSGDYKYIITSSGNIFKTRSLLDDYSQVDSMFPAYQFERNFYDNMVITASRNYNYDPPRIIHCYDIENNKVVWDQNINTRYVYLDEDLLIVDDSLNGMWKSIKRLSKRDGNVIWECNLESNIDRFLGVSKEVILIKCEDYTAGVDKCTGNIIWKYKLCHIYDPYTNTCYFLGGDRFISIEPQTGKEIDTAILDSDNFYATRQSPEIFKGYLATTNLQNKKVGFFNLKLKNYVEVFDINEGIALADRKYLKAMSNYTFLLTSNNKLKIYKQNQEA